MTQPYKTLSISISTYEKLKTLGAMKNMNFKDLIDLMARQMLALNQPTKTTRKEEPHDTRNHHQD